MSTFFITSLGILGERRFNRPNKKECSFSISRRHTFMDKQGSLFVSRAMLERCY